MPTPKMRFIMLCEYSGDRHSNPLHQFPSMEAAGPFDTSAEATAYEVMHRFKGCKQHSIVPLSPPTRRILHNHITYEVPIPDANP